MEMNKRVHEKGKYTNLQKVMIIGGGKTGFYLAEKLSSGSLTLAITRLQPSFFAKEAMTILVSSLSVAARRYCLNYNRGYVYRQMPIF